MGYTEHMVIGLTGGIGSGKSSAADLFAKLGVRIIDTDEISHALSKPPSPALNEITKCFGAEFLCSDGTLNRTLMREFVFSDPLARKKLERIFHPLILEQTIKEIDTPTTSSYTIIVVPLLFESRSFLELTRYKVVVDCSEELQIARVITRSRLSRQEVIAIMATQTGRQERLRQADDIILNSGTFDQLKEQVAHLHQRYLQLANSVQ